MVRRLGVLGIASAMVGSVLSTFSARRSQVALLFQSNLSSPSPSSGFAAMTSEHLPNVVGMVVESVPATNDFLV